MINSRQAFNENYKENYNEKYLTDIQRASKFYYKIKNSYANKGGEFGAKEYNRINALEHIREINERLSSVVVENLDFEKCIKKYDKEDTLFYIDPPYYSAEHYYKNVEFGKDDHIRLREVLKTIKGKFLLSYNDCPEIKELYRAFNIEEIERQNNIIARYPNKDRNYKELIIKNYWLERKMPLGEFEKTRVYFKINSFPEEIVRQVDKMLSDKNNTYSDVKNFLEEKGFKISLGAIGRYALNRNKTLDKVLEAQEQAKALAEVIK